jgi:hypothetical protein
LACSSRWFWRRNSLLLVLFLAVYLDDGDAVQVLLNEIAQIRQLLLHLELLPLQAVAAQLHQHQHHRKHRQRQGAQTGLDAKHGGQGGGIGKDRVGQTE